MREQNLRAGILLMIAVSFIFAVQDALSRHLASEYNTIMVVMIRYWFFAAFVTAIAARAGGGLRSVVRTARPGLQILRAVLLVSEVCVMVLAFVLLGLVQAHAVFAAFPLIVTVLSGPILGEKAGWRRWAAVMVGFAGILVILRPGTGVFTPAALIPLLSATLFALYSLLTRYAARYDPPETSFFWTGVVGAVLLTPAGLFLWQPMAREDWGWMLGLCVASSLSHYLLIRAYDVAEASAIQPFAYFQLVFSVAIGVLLLGEPLHPLTALGTAIVVSAGLFTFLRARQKAVALEGSDDTG
ncbi:DMT family transporter [Palleronia caenipelagi]|uniref:DMT family transporter n=1 Tax=Palleronia caenipelagi TaxID=2489174 RepID=A0A547Q709_9RHOB|nr:DMT family transporter [Palleronia caenipelagi]TRD22165.1 DMT family transporter [Palleronia caenipelagi]